MTVTCSYCGNPARLILGPELYPHRRDLAHVKAWRCDPCNAQVGCHDGTDEPKGTLAKPERQRARQAAHRVFDPLWQRPHLAYPDDIPMLPEAALRRIARDRAYAWLAAQMQVSKVHIGEMDEQQCYLAMTIIKHEQPTPASIRAWAKKRKAAP